MITVEEVKKAKEALDGIIHHTPLFRSDTFSRMSNAEIYLKAESLQKTGSFKVRGAYVKINSLSEEQKKNGVIAASAGNHGQGVAYASKMLGIDCTIVMPVNASPAKVAAIKGYGANVILHGVLYDQAWEKAVEISKEKNLTIIHAFDDPKVIAGQGTIALEILEELENFDAIVLPIGGGGLAAGISVVLKALKPEIKIIGVQSEAFDAMKKSIQYGRIVEISNGNTIADGISVKRPGELTFKILSNNIDDIVTVSDDDIVKAMFLLMERSKLVVEPAGAIGLAYMLSNADELKGKRVVSILTGGNIDMYLLGQIVSKGLVKTGRMLKIAIQLVDRPGELKRVVDTIVANRVNIVEVLHDRLSQDVAVGKAKVTLSLETEDDEHTKKLMEAFKASDIEFKILS
ncbi:MAG: threonine ammonia-lyase [Candidatus Nitrosothermus koennekii]|nr:MAG: threonine ammonia-lyase [Candidatus Nitrosothermus koennekii]